MDALGATDVVLPELTRCGGWSRARYHHLDVYEHTRRGAGRDDRARAQPGPGLGEHAEAVADLLAEPLANELTRGQALRFGALLHDMAKPPTRRSRPRDA